MKSLWITIIAFLLFNFILYFLITPSYLVLILDILIIYGFHSSSELDKKMISKAIKS